MAATRIHKQDLGSDDFATPAIVLGTAASAGTTGQGIQSDSTIVAFDATAPTTSALADAAAVGSATVAARRDHKHGRESFATPAIVLGSAAAAGSATTPIRSDGTIAAFDATNPSTQAFSDSPVVGTAAFAARRDHKHGMMANPGGYTTANFIDNEVPSGTVNGVNATFTLANTPTAGTVHLYKNGIRQTPGAGLDYTISTATITMLAGNLPQTGDALLADYRI